MWFFFRISASTREEPVAEDANACDRVPTAKGQRLVYVEHPELKIRQIGQAAHPGGDPLRPPAVFIPPAPFRQRRIPLRPDAKRRFPVEARM